MVAMALSNLALCAEVALLLPALGLLPLRLPALPHVRNSFPKIGR